LKRYQYRNAVTLDLWNALTEASGIPVADVMDTWTNQTGFPVISVEQVQDGNGNTTAVTLTQRRFLSHGVPDSDQFWVVPVTVCSMNDPDKILAKVIMEKNGDPQTFQLPVPEPGFVRLNRGAIGLYHVKYQENVLPSLISALSENKLMPRDRLSVVLDLFALVIFIFEFIAMFKLPACFRNLLITIIHLHSNVLCIDCRFQLCRSCTFMNSIIP